MNRPTIYFCRHGFVHPQIWLNPVSLQVRNASTLATSSKAYLKKSYQKYKDIHPSYRNSLVEKEAGRKKKVAEIAEADESTGGLIPLNVLGKAYKAGLLRLAPNKAAAVVRALSWERLNLEVQYLPKFAIGMPILRSFL
jgi:hypothetical protein